MVRMKMLGVVAIIWLRRELLMHVHIMKLSVVCLCSHTSSEMSDAEPGGTRLMGAMPGFIIVTKLTPVCLRYSTRVSIMKRWTDILSPSRVGMESYIVLRFSLMIVKLLLNGGLVSDVMDVNNRNRNFCLTLAIFAV